MDLQFALEWTLHLEAEILSLHGGQLGELGVHVRQVEAGDLLIEDLGQDIDANGKLLSLAELDVLLAERLVFALVQHDLGKNLVGEGAGHDEGGVPGSAAQVNKTTLGEEDDVATTLHEVSVNLRLDVLNAHGVLLQPGNIDLDIEMANVADNGIVGHCLEVLGNQDITAACGSDENLAKAGSLLHGQNLVARNSSLKGIDRVNLGDNDARTHPMKSHSTALSNVTVTSDNGNLTSNHHICSTLDTIDERLTATVKVVELGLGH